jgi:hypothetical protein
MFQLSQRTETGVQPERRIKLIFAVCRQSFQPVFRYSSFTAADEKVPLSIGQVKSVPQYLA